MRFDRVCYDFPELRIVMRHGAEPWEDLAVKLMLKWPGLYYMTSAFAPKYYPKAIIEYANTRGADKIMYAGYYPMGLSLERIFTEMPDVPFRDHVWPKFLRENAVARVQPLVMSTATLDRYLLISADTHAGGNHEQYREYLDPAYRDEFDAWRSRYQNPFRDLHGKKRNAELGRRTSLRASRKRTAPPPRCSSRTPSRRSSRRGR